MAEPVESVKKLLRSVLLSSKAGVKATRLQGEYHELAGGYIPHHKFGFPSLFEFLKTLDDVVRIGRDKENELTYYAIADSSTRHIQAMVAKQRPKKCAKKRSHLNYYRKAHFPNLHQQHKFHSNFSPRPKKFNNFSIVLASPNKTTRQFCHSSNKNIEYRDVRKVVVADRKHFEQNVTRRVVITGSGDSSSHRYDQHRSSSTSNLPPRFSNKLKNQEKFSSGSDSSLYQNPLGSLPKVSSKKLSNQKAIDSNMNPKITSTVESIEPHIKSNLKKLLSVNSCGLHSVNVSSLYKETFNEDFPMPFLQKIVSGALEGYATVEKFTSNNEEKFILYPYAEKKKEQNKIPSSVKYPTPSSMQNLQKTISVTCHSALVPGVEYKVVICHLCSTDEIYVQLVSESKLMREMHLLIKETFAKPHSPCAHLIKQGSFVITKASLCEARAKVISVLDKQVEIYDIDRTDPSGSFWTSIDQLQLMTPSISKYPQFCVRCSLRNPAGNLSKWLPESGERFYELYSDKELSMTPVTVSSTQSMDTNVSHHEHFVFFYWNGFNINSRLLHEETERRMEAKLNDCNPFQFQPQGCADLPSEEYCDLYVFTASCTTELETCVIGTGYYDDLVKLETAMFDYYSHNKNVLVLPQPPIDCVYAVLCEDTCIRGKLVSTEGDQGNIFLVDNGELDTVDLSDLRPLTEEFAKLPMQVITVSLAGLDHQVLSTHSSVLQKLNDAVVYKTCTAHIVGRFGVGTSKVCNVVELFDTGSDDVSINQMCLDLVFEENIWQKPLLPEVGSMNAVSVSSVDIESGCLFVRIAGDGMIELNECMTDVQRSFESQKMIPSKCANDLYPGKFCLASVSGGIYRARVEEVVRGKQKGISIFLIDVGSYVQVSRGMLFKMEDETILSVRPQAVYCKLSNCEAGDCGDFIATLKGVSEKIKSLPTLMRLDAVAQSEDPNLVSLWKNEADKIRIVAEDKNFTEETSSQAISEPLPVIGTSDYNNICDVKQPVDVQNEAVSEEVATDISDIVTSATETKQQIVSELPTFTDKLFPVRVEEVISPGHIQIIAIKNLNPRNILTAALNCHYQRKPGAELAANDIKVGFVYALYFPEENCWYRVRVLSKIHAIHAECMQFSVYLLDYGDCRVVEEISFLRMLHEKFQHICGLMITAKLAGILPQGGDEVVWSDDVSVHLRKLIQGKSYVAHVLKVTNEEVLQGREMYDICLCDTSTSTDVWINDLLVDEWNCAKYVQ